MQAKVQQKNGDPRDKSLGAGPGARSPLKNSATALLGANRSFTPSIGASRPYDPRQGLVPGPVTLVSGFPIGCYVHVPFCPKACDFCAFYQEKPLKADIKRFLEGIEQELRFYKPEQLRVDTCFFGGGTPGLLSAADFTQLGRMIKPLFRQSAPVEWTVEMAPSTVKPDKLEAMKALGVNRISMGVQSFSEKTLEALGRVHGPQQVFQAYKMIRKAGFQNVNLDLMFAIPGQSLADWEADLQQAIALAPEHISTYCLTFEEDTALYVKLSKGLIERNVAEEPLFYEHGWGILEKAGYAQYEISNFAKSGYECIHNINTWEMHNWIGLGPSAASQYKTCRYQAPFSLDTWLDRISQGKAPWENAHETLNEEILALDSLIFGLRMNKGVDLEGLRGRFKVDLQSSHSQVIENLIQAEYATLKGSQLALTPQGRLLADAIMGLFV